MGEITNVRFIDGMKFLEEDLLEYLQREEFAELRSAMVKRTFQKGAFVCQPSAQENRVFVVSRGRARVYLGYEDKEFNLGILNKGDIYSSHTPAFVQALQDLEILSLDAHVFRHKMMNDSEVAKSMIGVLGGLLRTSFEIIEGLAFKDVNSRLATLLFGEATRHGIRQTNGDILVEFDLPIEQIAFLLGSTRQTVSSLINEMCRQGFLERLSRGRFLVKDLHELENRSNPVSA